MRRFSFKKVFFFFYRGKNGKKKGEVDGGASEKVEFITSFGGEEKASDEDILAQIHPKKKKVEEARMRLKRLRKTEPTAAPAVMGPMLPPGAWQLQLSQSTPTPSSASKPRSVSTKTYTKYFVHFVLLSSNPKPTTRLNKLL